MPATDRSSPNDAEEHVPRRNPVAEVKQSIKKKVNGHMNGAPKGRVVDGWAEGTDPKIDQNPHFDFGGSFGVTAMMIGFPALMWYMWIGATYYDGKFPSEPSMSWSTFGKHMAHLVYTGAFPSLKAWTIYWTFLIVQAILYLTMPGVYSAGKPLAHEGGKQLRYYCNGVTSFYLTILLALGLHFSGIFKMYVLLDEFGPIMSVAIITGVLVSIVAYASALQRGAQHRMTGYHVYDFFMGAELNPRMFGWLDFKMFFEVRLPWFILFLISLAAAARQYELYGYGFGGSRLRPHGALPLRQRLLQRRRNDHDDLGHVLREMGLHAHLLEPRGRAALLLPLHDLPRQPRPGRVRVVQTRLSRLLHLLPLRLLDLGYLTIAEEHVPPR